MSTISRWVVPCYFTEEKFQTEPIEFDLTEHIKKILSNEVWNRKFEYGFGNALKGVKIEEILKAKAIIFPRFISGNVNENRIQELIDNYCNNPSQGRNFNNYKDWSHHIGVAIIELEQSFDLEEIPIDDSIRDDYLKYKETFLPHYHQAKAVLKELANFFLATLHLSFPSSSVMLPTENPLIDGFYQIESKGRMFLTKQASNAFMHEVLIETSKLSNIETNLTGLASVWHMNLWSLKRYLIAVDSDQIGMDNLLDLLFALEGMFDKSTSSEMIKTMCILFLCNSRKKAKEMKAVLDTAYKIRNDIVHGEKSYDSNDLIKIQGKETIAEAVFWEIKTIVASMLIHGISKLINNQEMRNLRFNHDDLINKIYDN